ncbi:Uncharacterized endoplasmic reticulum membrane protein YGL [Coccomyxa sp. Obi]|nr:Uncharacterized endoplasmic reticulum membrane protein YGL [Coccomyxa sp. Obi]
MTGPGLNFNLMDQLTFYGSYHTRGWNQAIHFVFVPLIHWTITVWLAYAPLPTSFDLPAHLDFLPPAISSAAVLNWGLLVLILYSLYYMALEPFAGATWGLLLGIPMWLTATAFAQYVPYAWAWAIGLHILSWYLQVEVGHILIEHRKPALLDSFMQSLVLAGLFAWMEGLFALGYRPKLHAELIRRVEENIARNKAEAEGLLTG